MTAQFQGKRAFVTVGNQRIGLAICQRLVTAGFEVILAARSVDEKRDEYCPGSPVKVMRKNFAK